MSVEQEVLRQAASRIGYVALNDPHPGSEAGRHLAQKMGQPWLQGPSKSVWWCMCFVSMCVDLAGQQKAIGGLYYNTETFKNANKNKIVSVASAKPGDIVLFDWDGRGVTDHVGFVEKNLGGGWLQTIEGNTSSGSKGSQSAGNGVWRRQRKTGINCVIRPSYSGSAPAASKPKTGKIAVDGIPGPETWAKMQQVMGTPVDGKKSWPSPMIQAFQRWLNSVISSNDIYNLTGRSSLEVDGYDGKKTWICFQYVAWNWHNDLVQKYAPGWNFVNFCDGIPGKITYKLLQEMLNLSKNGSGKLS